MPQFEESTPFDGAPYRPGSSVTLFQLGAIILEGRRFILTLALLGSASAFAIVAIRGPWFTATASFIPESGSDISTLMGLAGPLGIPLGSTSSKPSPDLYASLATSTVILTPIIGEPFLTTDSPGTTPQPLLDLLYPSGSNQQRRFEHAVERLQRQVSATFNRRTGTIALRVRTRWRLVSVRVAERILEQLNDFNLRTRQSQAKSERIFAEGRAVEARARLRALEEALKDFSVRNRRTGESPTLLLEVERLRREISLRQQLLISQEQSLESARLREVQDTPVITILQPPTALSVPDPRGRVKYTILGGVFGAMLAVVLLPARRVLRRGQLGDDPDADQFFAALADALRDITPSFARRARGAPGEA